MSLADEAASLSSDVPPAQGPKPGQASIDWDGTKGTLTTGTLDAEPKSWDDLITDWGLDPSEVQVVPGSVQIRAWDANVGAGVIRRLRYYRASLERRTGPGVDAEDLAEIKKALLRRKPVKAKATSLSQGTRIVLLSDWQIGKGDGDGVEGTVNRIVAGLEGAARAAKGSERIVLAGLGDVIEQCAGHYPSQQFTVELDRREQMRVARRLILRAVDLFAPLAPVDVVAVPGNHGECVDDQTEILTQSRGWVPAGAVEGDEVVATLNPATQAFEWQAMTAWTAQSYVGEMHHYKGSNIDLMVTPNHDCYRALWGNRSAGPDKWHKVQSSDNTSRSASLHAGRSWSGFAAPIVIPGTTDSRGLTRPGRAFGVDDLPRLARLLGWYVSEGNGSLGRSGGRVCISQSEEKNAEHHAEIVATLESLGYNAKPRWDQVRFSDRPTHDWLSANFGRTSKEKRLPRWLKDWPTELLEEFTLAYMKGDGHMRPEFTQTVAMTSTSDQLIDDMTEVMLKLGWRTNSSQARYERIVDGYVGSGRKLTANPRPTCEQPPAKTLHYEGMIYCPTVPNGLWFARRNGRTTVTGNSRLNGKAFTRTSDNDDVAVFEQVADIVGSSERYPDVRFGFPPANDQTTVTLNIGPGIALNHGHNLSNGSTGQQKANTWWKGQMAGHRPAGDCDILITGHYHHFVCYEGSGRTWFQCPAMDGGSTWWEDKTGNTSPPGMLSFTVGDYGARPWGDLALT